MGSVELYFNNKLLGRFPSPYAAARWVLDHDPACVASDGGEWPLRILRGWESKGSRSFIRDCPPAAGLAPTALHAEAEHIRMVGWSG
ncbi:hypothetical protein FG93_00647 [Bosea sp. LC85]|nr:hypothetical protein FG93_00647 [Bosea sp. LC85]